MENCDVCGQPMAFGHSLHIDQGRRNWRVCCMCTGELVARLSGEVAAPDVPSNGRHAEP